MSLLDDMLAAAIAASEVILEIYAHGAEATRKADGSPVTIADSRAEAVILDRLSPHGIPSLAEESVAIGRIPDLGQRFFVIDPLDGTREFLKRNGEFTVNIALAEAGRPTLGVIVAPATGVAYWGSADGAFAATIEKGALHDQHPIAADARGHINIVACGSLGHPALKRLCDRMPVAADVSVGSSLKFALLATGAAQLYPRFGPTYEWDTAAGQAILEAAGGVVLDLDGLALTCGHSARQYLNTTFVAAATRELALRAIEEMRAIPA